MTDSWVPAQGAAPATPPAGMSDEQVRSWVIATHMSGLVLLLGIPGVVGPLVIWLIQRQASPIIDAHGKEAINFQLSMLIYFAISAVLVLVLIGLVALAIVGIMAIVFPIVAGVKAANGQPFAYPLTIRFMR